MIRFRVEVPLDRSASRAAWALLSDIKGMPRFWGGHREVRVVENKTDGVMVAIRFAFPGPGNRGMALVSVDNASARVSIRYLKGPVRGLVVNAVEPEALSSSWSVSLAPHLRLFEPIVRRHFVSGTRHALERIAAEAVAQAPLQQSQTRLGGRSG